MSIDRCEGGGSPMLPFRYPNAAPSTRLRIVQCHHRMCSTKPIAPPALFQMQGKPAAKAEQSPLIRPIEQESCKRKCRCKESKSRSRRWWHGMRWKNIFIGYENPRRRACVGSHMNTHCRLESRRLARRRSSAPSRWDRMEFSPAATDAADFRPRADPQPSVTPQVRPPAGRARAASPANPPGRSDKRGCIGRLRARLGAKLLRIPPPRAENSFFFGGKMPNRTSPGQPTVFAAPNRFPIQAGPRSSARAP